MNPKETLIPLISTSVMGPLGIKHLPRLWLKIRLNARGMLAEGYRSGEGGYDEALLDHFGLDKRAFISFIETEQPDYLALERYVGEHAARLTPLAIAAFNEHVTKGSFSDPNRAKMFRDRVGLDDESVSAVIPLNDLDDWFGMHEALKS